MIKIIRALLSAFANRLWQIKTSRTACSGHDRIKEGTYSNTANISEKEEQKYSQDQVGESKPEPCRDPCTDIPGKQQPSSPDRELANQRGEPKESPSEKPSESKNIQDDHKNSPPATWISEGKTPPNENELSPQKKRPNKPKNIGDRRRPDKDTVKPKSQTQRLQSSEPQLRCREIQGSGEWEVLLVADDDSPLQEVQLSGRPLELSSEKECRIPLLTGQLNILCQGAHRYERLLPDNRPLIFKLRKNWTGDGHKISRLTKGFFIVIAPAAWERIGNAPIEPDVCTDSAFKAHYFFQDHELDDRVNCGFKEHSFPVFSGIKLHGQSIFDDSDRGDLFIGSPPELETLPEIKWVRVGEGVENGWSENFEPHSKSLSDVLESRQGSFYLRIYDSKVKLLDSTEFRYLHNLRQILVNGIEYAEDIMLLPTPEGYEATEIHFITPNDKVLPNILQANGSTLSQSQPGIFKIPPSANTDYQAFELPTTDDKYIKVELCLPRVWWMLKSNGFEQNDWGDTPIELTRQDFKNKARSNGTLRIKSKFKSCKAGFDNDVHQLYSRKADEHYIDIPLMHFADHQQIRKKIYEDAHFNIEQSAKVLAMIKILADPAPMVVSFSAEPSTISIGESTSLSWLTKNSGESDIRIEPSIGIVDSHGTCIVQPNETTQYMLFLPNSDSHEVKRSITVHVKSDREKATIAFINGRGRWRAGKGFSQAELKCAGVTVEQPMIYSIALDKRRRTAHKRNIDTLKGILND